MAEFRIVIDGREYGMPAEETLTLDEAIVIHDYSKLTLDQIEGNGGHPGLIKALIHIAVARARKDLTAKDISGIVGSLTLTQLVEAQQGSDARPPDSPEESKPSGDANSSDELHGGKPSNGDGALSQEASWPEASGTPV